MKWFSKRDGGMIEPATPKGIEVVIDHEPTRTPKYCATSQLGRGFGASIGEAVDQMLKDSESRQFSVIIEIRQK